MWSNEAVNTMKLSRRQFLRFAASAPALSAASRPKANIRGHIWCLRQVRRAHRPKTPEGAANSTYVHFLFGLIFKYEATTEQGHRSQGPNYTARPRRRGDRMKGKKDAASGEVEAGLNALVALAKPDNQKPARPLPRCRPRSGCLAPPADAR